MREYLKKPGRADTRLFLRKPAVSRETERKRMVKNIDVSPTHSQSSAQYDESVEENRCDTDGKIISTYWQWELINHTLKGRGKSVQNIASSFGLVTLLFEMVNPFEASVEVKKKNSDQK